MAEVTKDEILNEVAAVLETYGFIPSVAKAIAEELDDYGLLAED